MRLALTVFILSSMLVGSGQILNAEAHNIQSQAVKESSSECKNLSDVLYTQAKTQLESANLRLTEETEPKLIALVNNAADTLANATNKQCIEAKNNFSRFIAALIKNSQREGNSKMVGPEAGVVTVEAFDHTKNSICPLYPFC